MTLPIGDVNPTVRKPWVTLGLIAANIVVFLLVQPHGETCAAVGFTFEFGAVPEEMLSGRALSGPVLDAALGPCADQVSDKNVALSLLSSMFLHGSLPHLLGNMLFLWVFGNNVEDHLGRLRFLGFYVVCGLLAYYGYAAVHPDLIAPVIGASGAVAGVLGAYLLTFPRARVHSIVPLPFWPLGYLIPGWKVRAIFIIAAVVTIPAWVALGAWFVLEGLAAPDTGSGVAVEAHVAGFAAGVGLMLALDPQRRSELLRS